MVRSCSEYQAIDGLYFSTLLNRQNSAHCLRWNGNDALSCSGFWWIDDDPGFRLLQITRDMNFTFTGINIMPLERKDFPKSHSRGHCYEKKA